MERTNKEPIFNKAVIIRFMLMLIANVILAVGIFLLRMSSFGTDPFNCMNLGVSSHLPISYGTYQLLVNLVLFIPLVILKPRIFGMGAIVNMFGLAYIVEFCTWTAGQFGITIEGLLGNMPVRIMLLIAGLVALCFGVALYMECDMGTAAYDALGQVVDERTHGKLQFRWVRVATDIICIAIGFFTGSVVGIATLVAGFFTGPLVAFFRKHMHLEKLKPAKPVADN